MAAVDHSYEIVSRKEAIARGLNHYCTGKPCKRGHIAKRFVNGSRCTVCSKNYLAGFRASHREMYREFDRKQKNKDREKLRERDRKKYWENPDKCRLRVRQYYLENAELVKERTRTDRRKKKLSGHPSYLKTMEENRARAKEWQAANPEKVRVHRRHQRARRKNVPGTHTADDISEILKWQRGRCALCRIEVGKKYHVDHIIPIAKGVRNDRRNLQVLCRSCNLKKGAQDQIDMMQSLGRLL